MPIFYVLSSFSYLSLSTPHRRRMLKSVRLVDRNKFRTLTDNPWTRGNNFAQNRVRVSAKEQSDPIKPNPKPQRYHPFEDIENPGSIEIGEARLTPAETTRTVIEVNSKAMLIISGLVTEDLDENIFWPDLPYVTDEHGNIYLRMKNDEDILKTLTSEDNPVLVVIGLDATEMINEIESLSRSEVDFGFDEIDVEDSDMDDEDDEYDSSEDEDDDEEEDDEDEDGDYGKDWVGILEDDDEDEEDSNESLGDWAKLETMRSSHPMHFAKKIAEFVTEDPVDFMVQPPAGLAIQALLRPAFVEEHSGINKRTYDHHQSDEETSWMGDVVNDEQDVLLGTTINGQKHEVGGSSSHDGSIWAKELDKDDESLEKGTSFYKLELIKIQLILAHGRQAEVDVEDYRRAKPDAIAHSAAKIISRIKAGGEKTMNALKSLCWRCKGIQVEEVALIGVDSLGFDLRVCSGAQVQTLRFSFGKRASSEYGAERQLNDLLFPRIQGKHQKKKKAQQSEL
ncbi:hypothetical protein LguiA_024126 [Lonicera macranthoides]